MRGRSTGGRGSLVCLGVIVSTEQKEERDRERDGREGEGGGGGRGSVLDEMDELLARERPLRELLDEVVLDVLLPDAGRGLDEALRERVRVDCSRSAPRHHQDRPRSVNVAVDSLGDAPLDDAVHVVERSVALSERVRELDAEVRERGTVPHGLSIYNHPSITRPVRNPDTTHSSDPGSAHR